ncbi:unnamed protein product [Diabrotica balteata]|uniref:Uncharacterized protein n=1 Tax=Diabrotica balteata TaxID=107213 RepID=A0A9N9SMM0_DIABA|nr:unnamed protein product [Diabrotica balteata]
MNSNRMTGEPNQQTPASVFGFDSYPPLFAVNWNQANPFTNTMAHPDATLQQQYQMLQRPDSAMPFSTSNSPPLPNQIPNQIPFSNMPLPGHIPNSVHPEYAHAFGQQLSGFSFGSPRPTQELVQFPFQGENSRFGNRELGCKRKTESPPLQPAKQHITEEKMAEHMSKLHISSETASPRENDASRMQRLYMCEEMRKLKTDPILPQSLLSKMQNPCTALVLWKPPTRFIPVTGNNEIDENENNNRDTVPDHHNQESDDVEDEMSEVCMNNMDLDSC